MKLRVNAYRLGWKNVVVIAMSASLAFGCQGANQEMQSAEVSKEQVTPSPRPVPTGSSSSSQSGSGNHSSASSNSGTPSSNASSSQPVSSGNSHSGTAASSGANASSVNSGGSSTNSGSSSAANAGSGSVSSSSPSSSPSSPASSGSQSGSSVSSRKRLVFEGEVPSAQYRLRVGAAYEASDVAKSEEGLSVENQYGRKSTCRPDWLMTGFKIGYNDWNWFEDSVSYLRLKCRDQNYYQGGELVSEPLGVDGPGVDTDKNYSCTEGEFMTGVQVRMEDYVIAARPRCGRVQVLAKVYSDGSRTHQVRLADRNYPTAMYNRSQRDDRDQLVECMNEHVLVGLKVTYKRNGSDEAALTRVRPVCAPLTAVRN